MDDGDFVGDSEDEEMDVENAPLPSPIKGNIIGVPAVVQGGAGDAAALGDDEAMPVAPSIDEDSVEDRRLHVETTKVEDANTHAMNTQGIAEESTRPNASMEVLQPSKRDGEPLETTTQVSSPAHQQDPVSSVAHPTVEFQGAPVPLVDETKTSDVSEVMPTGPLASFKVGDIVHVAARTWPGINKLGGAGKIASVIKNLSGDGNVEFLYNVKYMLGGFEKRIEEEFIQDLQLETGVRPHKERVFYHDEYTNNPQTKKKPTAASESAVAPPPQNAPDVFISDGLTRDSSASVSKLPKKRSSGAKKAQTREKTLLVDAPDIEFHVRSSDDSDYDEEDAPMSDPPNGDDQVFTRRLDDDSFILDERHSEVGERKRSHEHLKGSTSRNRDKVERKSKHDLKTRHNIERTEPRPRKKRSHRIIESEEEEEEEEAERGENDSSVQRRSRSESRPKKRRYIGGYEHGSADADGSFIQPEGNPTELPDDVVKELKFKLGTTKAELRSQLEMVADRFLENLGDFDEMKKEVATRLELTASLDEVELQDVNHKLLELGQFVRAKFIRSGEDVMNLIIRMLEKKGASLPDRIDLQYEGWKERVAEHDAWVKQSLHALSSSFSRRGFLDAFTDEAPREQTSSESDRSSESDHSDPDDSDFLKKGQPVDVTERMALSSSSGLHQSRQSRRGATRGDSFVSSPMHSRSHTKKRPRASVRTQSSLDNFAVPFDEIEKERLFKPPKPLTTLNFRFLRGRDDKILKDPRWDWARTLNRNRPRENGLVRSRGAPLAHAKSTVVPRSKSQTSESVMEAVFKLRDKRYRDRNVRQNGVPQPRVVQSAHTMPLVSQSRGFTNSHRIPFEEPRAIGNKAAGSSVSEEAEIVVAQDPRKWKSIFRVLDAEENIPSLQTEQTANFVPLGNPLQDAELGEDVSLSALGSELTVEAIANQMVALRQSLNTLRASEQAELDCIMKERSRSGEEESSALCGSWLALSALADGYHKELEAFVENLRHSLRVIHPGNVSAIVQSTVTELSLLLKHIPDCATICGDSPSYAYFFEIASPGARKSPLIKAICRTYWYSIQLLLFVKTTCECCWPDARKDWEPIIAGSLSPNRVALACCLFLIDLYIHIPSTHRFSDESSTLDNVTDMDSPAHSLWQSLHELFASGTIQSNKFGETSSLWHLLQTAYKQGLVDLVSVSFIKRESFGGYIRERAPPKVLDSDEDLQGKLLAADVMWDLSCLLGSLFHPIAKSKPLVLSSSWNLIRQLLSADSAGFIPLAKLPESDALDQEFQLQAHGFKLRVLRRLLVLSAIWPPESDILEKLFPHLWDSVLEEEDQAVLSSIISFVGEVRQLDDRTNDTHRYVLARQHATSTTNSVELFCKIAVVQLSNLDKPIHRVRFRQPLLRAISGRVESNKSALAATSKRAQDSSTVNAPKSASIATKSWSWGKNSGGGSSRNAASLSDKLHTLPQTHVPASTPKQIIVEVNSVLSIVLMLGVASLYLDEEPSVSQQSARRKRDLKREIDFFCKELASVSCEVPEASVRLCECVLAVGTVALDMGVSFSAPFERIDKLLKWTVDSLQHARPADPDRKHLSSPHFKVLAAAASSCLRSMRDLSAQLFEQVGKRLQDEPEEVELSLSAVLGSGLAGIIDAVVDGGLPLHDLDLAIETMMTWMPTLDIPPTQSLQYLSSAVASSRDEFDEFDDPEMMHLLAAVDLETATSSTVSTADVIRDIQSRARGVAVSSLRLSIQKLVVAFPQKRWRSYQELYVIDLLGNFISTCKFPFSWAAVALTSLKPRMLAPRLMASVLQHRGDSDWFATCFLSEQNADVELSSMWLTATLDLRSLFPTASSVSSPGIPIDNQQCPIKTARYSSYWLKLTDGILVNLLKEDHVVRYKMDQLMHQFLHSTATMCSYGTFIRESTDPSDVRSLYTMHVNVFGAFCRSAGHIWQSLCADPVRHRQDMNRFRVKMMDTQRGVFVALPEAYEVNLRAVCRDLDHTSRSWYSLSGRFLDEFSAPNGHDSFHAVDDAMSMLNRELADPAIRPLIILFKFMYDCVDSFLFHCGGMAIGQQNIFYAIIELMFRQARCAEFPVAERRVSEASASNVLGVTTSKQSAVATLAGVSPGCIAFAESVRLFFAYQKYPSLINWFAQNLETYQTLKAGWMTSPLRVLLYNVFDPHGPLGIHSYYPMQDGSTETQFDPSKVRREAFYVACGLLHCRCTNSYEHTRCAVHPDHEERRAQLRRFVLTSFASELRIGAVVDGDNMDEYLLPYYQLVKAFLNHLNLDDGVNLREETSDAVFRVDRDLMPCLVIVAEYAVQKLCERDPVDDITSCVILIEFFCILEELVHTSGVLQNVEIQRFVGVGLRCAGYAYHRLSRFSSVPLEKLFTDDCVTGFSANGVLSELSAVCPIGVKTEPDLLDVKEEPALAKRNKADDYGIGKAHVRSDLLAVIRRLVKTCTEHGGHRLLQCTGDPTRTVDLGALAQHPRPHTSVDGTM